MRLFGLKTWEFVPYTPSRISLNFQPQRTRGSHLLNETLKMCIKKAIFLVKNSQKRPKRPKNGLFLGVFSQKTSKKSKKLAKFAGGAVAFQKLHVIPLWFLMAVSTHGVNYCELFFILLRGFWQIWRNFEKRGGYCIFLERGGYCRFFQKFWSKMAQIAQNSQNWLKITKNG